ncbi:MAG: hypothetical protein ABWX61_07315 [Paenisporosarcina sp.]
MKLVLLVVLSFIMLTGCTNNQGSSIGTMEEKSRDEAHEAGGPTDSSNDDNNNPHGQSDQTDTSPNE